MRHDLDSVEAEKGSG